MQRWHCAKRQQGTSAGRNPGGGSGGGDLKRRKQVRKKATDGRGKADITRDWGRGLQSPSFYQLNRGKSSVPWFSSLGTPILGQSQNPCQDLITILVTQTQGGGRHLLRRAQHSGALKRTPRKEVRQETAGGNRLLLPGTQRKGSLTRTNTEARESLMHSSACSSVLGLSKRCCHNTPQTIRDSK